MNCKWNEIGCHFQWRQDEIKAFFLWIYEKIILGVADLISQIPTPDFMQNIQSLTLPPTAAYFAEPFQLLWGLGIFLTAFTVRFMIRRIPFIG